MKKLLWSLITQFVSTFDSHLKDDVLVRLLCGELSDARAVRADRHLAGCPKCLSRYRTLETAEQRILEYKRSLLTPSWQQSMRWREIFVDRLDQLLLVETRVSWWAKFHSTSLRTGFLLARPLLLGALVPAVIVVLLSWLGAPHVTASQFLNRAVLADLRLTNSVNPGVVRQRLRIRTANAALEQLVWRDAKRVRRLKPQKLQDDGEQVWKKLEMAGVNQEEPLSARDYQVWHDRQISASDAVGHEQQGLITITTTMAEPEGNIAQETISLREVDLHVVERTVRFRDVGTVEIAELDFAVLDWTAANDALFEPVSSAAPGPSASHSFPKSSPRMLSKVELDDAELQARLALNRLDADTGEQIQLVRTPNGIEVQGVVASDQRKHDIEARLLLLKQVRSSIYSLDELPTQFPPEHSPTSIGQHSVTALLSPLQQYFMENGRGNDDLAQISQQLFDHVLTISQEVNSLADLQQRFVPSERLSEPGRSALLELVTRHKSRLLAALDGEARDIAALGMSGGSASSNSGAGSRPVRAVNELAERNSALCKELIAGKEGSSRSAESIAGELSDTINELRTRITQEPEPRFQ